MMRDVARLVVEEYDGSLKAEHGTGRNMAPFVKYEWRDKAFEAMKELKAIFDPEGLLNQGVIFNDDPECFIKCLKPLPVLDYDFSKVPDGGHYLMDPKLSTAHETIEQVKRANKCIECGFCEVNCMSCPSLAMRYWMSLMTSICSSLVVDTPLMKSSSKQKNGLMAVAIRK